jgi:hypothetical protein
MRLRPTVHASIMKILGRNNSLTAFWLASINIDEGLEWTDQKEAQMTIKKRIRHSTGSTGARRSTDSRGSTGSTGSAGSAGSAGWILSVTLTVGFFQCPAFASNWYPKSADPYPGTAFHCDLKGLPPDMPGIKTEDREFIDHSCAVLLKCAQEKELMLTALNNNKGTQALPRYEKAVREQLEKLKTVSPPSGLEPFKADVIKAISLQIDFFRKAVKAKEAKTDINSIMSMPEGKQASQYLFAAWDEIQRRYLFFWGGSSKDCIYHHLCAFDLF